MESSCRPYLHQPVNEPTGADYENSGRFPDEATGSALHQPQVHHESTTHHFFLSTIFMRKRADLVHTEHFCSPSLWVVSQFCLNIFPLNTTSCPHVPRTDSYMICSDTAPVSSSWISLPSRRGSSLSISWTACKQFSRKSESEERFRLRVLRPIIIVSRSNWLVHRQNMGGLLKIRVGGGGF